MTTNEYDLMIDEASETAFPFLDDLNERNEMSDIELRDALCDEYKYSEMMASRIYDAWYLRNTDRYNKKLADGLKEPHPAHKARMKVLETVVKELL
tara:strand:- start:8563 stop:8850 length:288 start_codon:yes stop_codon:yes gene_type:complete